MLTRRQIAHRPSAHRKITPLQDRFRILRCTACAALLLGMVLSATRAAHGQEAPPRSAFTSQTPVWTPVGPLQVNTPAWNLVTGPVTSIAADPSDLSGNTVYLGTDGGGVWKSGNAAESASAVTFRPLTDSLSVYSSASLTSLSIGAVTVQPGGTGIVLAGTGDWNTASDSWFGAGILRSSDGGNTWSLINTAGSSFTGAGFIYSFVGSAFTAFAWSTTTPNLVVAAVTNATAAIAPGPSVQGLFYSTNAGKSWDLATLQDGSQGFESNQLTMSGGNAATAVVWNPVRRRFYAAIRSHGYYESLDGMTWTRLVSQPGANLTTSLCPANPLMPGSPNCPIARAALAVQPATGDLFALTVDSSNRDQGLWRDACNLTSGACRSNTVQFSTQIGDQALDAVDGTLPQATANLTLAAIPSQQDTLLFVGAADLWKCSLANNCAWRNTTNTATCVAAQVGPAQQAIDATFGAGGLLYFGNSDGLWRSTDAVNQQGTACSTDDAAHFQNLNGGLGSLAQIESFSDDPANPATWLAALGDLGTAAPGSNGGAWNLVLNGNGNVVAIDPVNPDLWYATSVAGVGIHRCPDGTTCDTAGFGSIAIGATQVAGDQQTIRAPWILDPVNTTQLILGTCRVWRGPATGIGWSQNNLISGILDGQQSPFCNGNAEIRSLAAAPITTSGTSGAEQLYVGMAGLSDGGGLIPGHVFTATITSDAGATTHWTDVTSSPVTNHFSAGMQFNPSYYDIASLCPDPHDPTGQTVYVTVHGISAYSNSPLLYRSTDAGAHWSDITANLPAAPANSIVIDPANANIAYLALDSGVYFTQNVASCAVAGAQCWNIYGSGLPTSPVTSLMVYSQGSTQLLRAGTGGRGIWEVPLLTAGETVTTAALSPQALIFAPQQVQTTSANQTITVTNTGSAALTIANIVITGDFTETDNCIGPSIAPGSSCSIQVGFAPVQTGSRTGELTMYASVVGGQLTATMTGTGLPPATIVLTPSTLAFAGTTIGARSAPQYITIANTGGAVATLTSEILAGDFSFSANTCGTSLSPNTSCTVGILFTPTAAGTRNGSLTVADAVGVQTALLSGTGQTPATDALAPLALTFAAQQVATTSLAQPVTLTNSGDQPLTSIAVTVTGDFTAANNCGAVLQAHGSCAISVAYAPTRTGAETGTLKVTDEFRTQTTALSGTGLAPPGVSATPASIDFGNDAVATTSSARIVTVTNTGGFALTNLAAAITSGFALATNNCPATLTTGSTCQIGVTFSPAAAATITGTLTISAANLSVPLSVALSGSGTDFTMSVSGASSVILTSGQAATFALQLSAPAGTSGIVALTCAGAPKNAQCSLNPTSLILTGLNSSSATMTIATGLSSTTASHRNAHWTATTSALALMFPLCWAGLRRRRHSWLPILIAALGLTIAGCGVTASNGSGSSTNSTSSGSGGTSSGSQNQTPSGTYPITITATMSNITHSVQVNVIVQ